ncbi:YdjC-like protein [Candidatus Omnitrophus magneticus]|uniref:YdjC-like protein n=1 Tax=Candidatus Omnitrophus magneticus TaxID=1609969 RepID=A0A0F0CQG3_9BACT|nr:YdjC-like protein [Candidatus Omnitrophus magneticus]
MKYLIINADDFGKSIAINSAIKKCFTLGTITGASIMPVAHYFDDAVSITKELGIKEIGAHLTLSGNFAPVTKGKELTVLRDNKKMFPYGYQEFLTRYLFKKIGKARIHEELSSQLQRIKETGLKITHIDSHEHIHILPAIFDVIINLAKTFNVPYIRIPFESGVIARENFTLKNFSRYCALRGIFLFSRENIKYSNLKHNSFFWGHFHSGNITENVFNYMISNLNEGCHELAIHPALFNPEFIKQEPWHKNSHKELKLFENPYLKNNLLSKNIKLISHSEYVLLPDNSTPKKRNS